MARRTEHGPHLSRSATTSRRTRSTAASRRLSGLAPEPALVPQPRTDHEDADTITSEHPIMHWVLVTDDSGRTRPEARWL
ncbi:MULTISPECIES: hypothetical protein [unclassified Nocardiopsis]|uniref:hypothetical protein n=1 Tax=unclassified Nocardiopsis TaxID=2649073 RepID=UPI00066A4B38|nr:MULTISPECIES: hypothetical protein [unclassified Nocardiopsis]MBQ1081799.1 hypothetical protein [Nocardiopsis sp. B62]